MNTTLYINYPGIQYTEPVQAKISPLKPPFGLLGKDVSGSVELFFMGNRIDFKVYNSRQERSEIIEQWRESIGTPYHSNEYYLLIKNDL